MTSPFARRDTAKARDVRVASDVKCSHGDAVCDLGHLIVVLFEIVFGD